MEEAASCSRGTNELSHEQSTLLRSHRRYFFSGKPSLYGEKTGKYFYSVLAACKEVVPWGVVSVGSGDCHRARPWGSGDVS